MTATCAATAFASPLTVYCRSIAGRMTRYWRFGKVCNVRRFRNLRSDSPLLSISRNCLPGTRSIHALIASGCVRSETAAWLLFFSKHRINDAFCSTPGLTCAHRPAFVSLDIATTLICTEQKQCSFECARRQTLSVCTAIFAPEFCLEYRHSNVGPPLKLCPGLAYDKRHVSCTLLFWGFMVRCFSATIAQLTTSLHQMSGVHPLAISNPITVLHQHITST